MGRQELKQEKKYICAGLLAHVDAGKTTLSEALLYHAGQIRKLGRVDHGDAFLDTESMERERGITIFSKQAVLPLEGAEITLLDTPGHVDFSSEMERTLQVLDCAVLVISGPDGVQSHTRTLWRLLARYGVPTFLFINKMDLTNPGRQAILEQLRRLDEGCVDFGAPEEELWEQAALADEGVLNRYLDTGRVEEEDLAALVGGRKLFPCYFGSALKLEGVGELAAGLARYTRQPEYGTEMGARVFKISRDPQGARLTWLKVTGGSIRVKMPLDGEEKAEQIRVYSGAKFRPAEEAPAGSVCAVTGLSSTRPGQGLGVQPDAPPPALAPVLTYQVALPDGCDPHTALGKLRQLEEEDPTLHVVWDGRLREIHMQLMGQVQIEILERLIRERFGLEVSFGAGSIVYRETIAAPVLGAGHFEPLRHYAEVHLLLEPGERGSGLRFASACPDDMLDGNWQRLILTHLMEKEHLGVLTGSPITDLTITLLTGRAHVKHTEGGDFRQATYRAVRQGLMGAQSILLEPWYDFRLEVPAAQVGRALSDLQQMGADAQPPQTEGELTVISGGAPVAGLRDYAAQVAAYTRGEGRLFCTPGGYRPCPNQEKVAAEIGYQPLRDVDNPADSVFCEHGAGHTVSWEEAPARMHVQVGGRRQEEEEQTEKPAASSAPPRSYGEHLEQDKQLQAIFERTYGPVKRRDMFRPAPRAEKKEDAPSPQPKSPPVPAGPEYLLVDGYNIIFAWEELKRAAGESLDAARQMLMDVLSNYQGYRKCRVILVFDAYKVPHGTGEVSRYHNITVVYTKHAETADTYIEKATYQLGRQHRVRVATSDGVEQLIILGHGALRLSARAFRAEVDQAGSEIAAILARNNRREKSRPVKAALERAEEKAGQ